MTELTFLQRRAGILPQAGQRMKTLLDVPVHKLLEDLSVSAATKPASECVITLHFHGRLLTTQICREAQPSKPVQLNTTNNANLWVDRYRPSRFTELLGDDRVHREVLAWVKEWDCCVFGKNKNRGRKRARDDADGENLDQWQRPREKASSGSFRLPPFLLLLSGPPGLGKTTLAHVVAQHAGYNVFEINASDARSADVVDDRIRPALESGARIGSSKPNLVVIDEIDGATGGSDSSSGFIHKLIQLTQDRPQKKQAGGRNPHKSGGDAARPVLRPIICICNDLYAASLTKLRQHARIVRFSRPHDTHVVRRLREICEREGVKADARALATLVGVAQGDFRGCLNTLQMLKAKAGGGGAGGGVMVTEPMVRSATRGMKEAEAGQMAVLNDLFAPLSRRRAKEMGVREDEPRYVGRLSQAVENCDSLDKVAIGCFEHYANLHRHDASFERYSKGMEWLCRWDVLMGAMRAEREYALLPYMPYPLVAFYPLFQDRGAPKVERPKADWEHYTQTKTNEEIYKSLARCLRTAAARCGGDWRHLASDTLMQLELAPYLNRIVSPPLRPVNSQVIRPAEKAVLARLVSVMANLELRFVQEKTEEGQLVYRLDPPIDVFVTYDGKRAADIAVSRYAVRHLVAAEIDAQVIARQAEGIEKNKAGKSAFFGGASKDKASADDAQPLAKKPRQDDKPAEKIAVDFFGRPIVSKDKPESASGKNAPKEKVYRVAYKFKEGNSAAVRKPVKVSAWL
ncbi:P-loop containing nucleoside triphosphate hydrolase protein [Dichomitus squalens]|uniref:P-loop containing nucleoside triphosphate hydrolase protein n=1 Tax=Dichomitus squalens TaxID=114155 RepID=A0A4Q9N636_9APHY|nr:P-loop containing nucleoside triphosphate hydrolase protein [Dichomitus squalens]